MSASGTEGIFRPIRVFGREIRFWPLILLAALALMAVGVMLNNSNLSITEQTVTVVGLPEDMEGYRIVVLSDMNGRRFGDSQSLLLRTLNGIKYDAIFCLGDMVGKSGNAQPFWEFLEGLKRPEKVYFICGDSDPGPYLPSARGTEGMLSQLILEDWILGAIERGANYVDAPISIPVKKSTLWLSPATMLNLETISTLAAWQDQTEQEEDGVRSGITDDYTHLPITTYRSRLAQKLYDAQRTMTASDIHISLSHEIPSEAFIYTSEDHKSDTTEHFLASPDLILAGHYCGGVWRLPVFGAFYVPDKTLPRGGWFPDQQRVSGLSEVGETQIYITRGLSTSGSVPLMPFRLFNSPEISVVTLTSTLPENMLEAG
jgi:predicted MPP superfamily phosphohydrolase